MGRRLFFFILQKKHCILAYVTDYIDKKGREVVVPTGKLIQNL